MVWVWWEGPAWDEMGDGWSERVLDQGILFFID